MVKKGQIDNGLGYEYGNMNGEIFFEFHVDDHELFQNMCSNLPFGGHLSVRFPPNKKTLMLISQDECISSSLYLPRVSGFYPMGQDS